VISNFRDVGGVPTADGHSIRTGVLFRSASLADLTPEGLGMLAELGIRTVIDLRRADEVTNYGRVADAGGRSYVNLPPTHTPWSDREGDELLGAARFLADRYLELARDGGRDYARVLRLIAARDSAPVVVHCYAGKDRTGVAIALALALAGVADADIADDYALTDGWSKNLPPVDLPAHWIAAPPEAITLFLADLRAAYGSVNAYAASIGLVEADIAALRQVLIK
jgi:protein-tyrosine phosphatase